MSDQWVEERGMMEQLRRLVEKRSLVDLELGLEIRDVGFSIVPLSLHLIVELVSVGSPEKLFVGVFHSISSGFGADVEAFVEA